MAGMKTAGLVIGVVVAAIIGVLFLPVVSDAVGSSTGSQDVTNETVTGQHGEWVELGGYDIDENSETVWGYNDTSGSYEQAIEGTDYDIRYSEGEIQANSSSTLIDDGEQIKVSYTYQATGSTTTLVAGFVPLMIGLLVFVSVAMKVRDMV
jgi:hypothetical protein